jgi:hypothetical protein
MILLLSAAGCKGMESVFLLSLYGTIIISSEQEINFYSVLFSSRTVVYQFRLLILIGPSIRSITNSPNLYIHCQPILLDKDSLVLSYCRLAFHDETYTLFPDAAIFDSCDLSANRVTHDNIVFPIQSLRSSIPASSVEFQNPLH